MNRLIFFGVLLSAVLVHSYHTGSYKNKISYVCPPHFMRIGRRCYFFSKKALPWQQAFFQCQNKKSWLAVIKSEIQDRHVRKTLRKEGVRPYERWLGAQYNWNQKLWVWGSTGKNLTYSGFEKNKTITPGEWDCLIMDPTLKYMWNARPCHEKKPFICQTKIKIATRTQRDKMRREYNVDKYNKLNEIPVPDIPKYDYKSPMNELRRNYSIPMKTKRSRFKKKPRKRVHFNDLRKNTTIILHRPKYKHNSRNKRIDQNQSMENIKYDIYYKEDRINSLYPKPIIEEYSFVSNRP